MVSISDVTINKDIMTDSHFPRFFGVVVQCEKRSKNSSRYNFWKYRYFKWGSFLNPNGFKFVIFLYILCETFRSKQAEFTKFRVNLWEIWGKFKCRKNRVRPPLKNWTRLKTLRSDQFYTIHLILPIIIVLWHWYSLVLYTKK